MKYILLFSLSLVLFYCTPTSSNSDKLKVITEHTDILRADSLIKAGSIVDGMKLYQERVAKKVAKREFQESVRLQNRLVDQLQSEGEYGRSYCCWIEVFGLKLDTILGTTDYFLVT